MCKFKDFSHLIDFKIDPKLINSCTIGKFSSQIIKKFLPFALPSKLKIFYMAWGDSSTVEQLPFKQLVQGSNPCRPTKLFYSRQSFNTGFSDFYIPLKI